MIHVAKEHDQLTVQCTDHPDYIAVIIPGELGLMPAGLVVVEANEHLRRAHTELPAQVGVTI